MNSAVRSFRSTMLRSTVLAFALCAGGCSTLESVGDSIFGSSADAKRVPGQRISLMPRGQDAVVQDPAFAGMAVGVPAAGREADPGRLAWLADMVVDRHH